MDEYNQTLPIWLYGVNTQRTFTGTLGFLMCMLGGAMYQQSTNKKRKAVQEDKPQEQHDEQNKLQQIEEAHKL
ncbi:hypothetical protein Bca4012_054108 [Brassica carinata]